MNILSLLLIPLLTLTPARAIDIRLELGATLDARAIPRKKLGLWPTDARVTKFDPCFVKEVNGVKYLIAYDKETSQITYVSTYDSNFKTGDGLMAGQYIDVSREQIKHAASGEMYALTSVDGWRVIVGSVRRDLSGHSEDLTVLKDGREVDVDLIKSAARGIDPFEGAGTLKVRIRGFSKGNN